MKKYFKKINRWLVDITEVLKNTEKDKKPISIEKSNGNGLYEQMLGLMGKDQQSPQSM